MQTVTASLLNGWHADMTVTASLLEILKKTAKCLLYRDPHLIENAHRQHSRRPLRVEGLSKWDTVQWIVIRCVGHAVCCHVLWYFRIKVGV